MLSVFQNSLELSDENWFNQLTLKSQFSLNSLKFNQTEKQIDKSYNCNTAVNIAGDIRKIYRHPSLDNHYKVKNGIIVGFGLLIIDLTRKDFERKFGKPKSDTPIIGEIWNWECFEILGYELDYGNFRVIEDMERRNLESIQFGEKLLFEDE